MPKGTALGPPCIPELREPRSLQCLPSRKRTWSLKGARDFHVSCGDVYYCILKQCNHTYCCYAHVGSVLAANTEQDQNFRLGVVQFPYLIQKVPNIQACPIDPQPVMIRGSLQAFVPFSSSNRLQPETQ